MVVETEQVLPTGTERILLIDDEQIVVKTETAILERLGYKVTPETNSLRALEIFRFGPGEFDLVITDYTMPKLTGIDLFKEIRQIRPDIPIILCTGFSEKATGDVCRRPWCGICDEAVLHETNCRVDSGGPRGATVLIRFPAPGGSIKNRVKRDCTLELSR